MPRELPLSNGRMLIAFDAAYQIVDVYYPHVGSENHSVGHRFRVGAWVNGRFSWFDAPGWRRELRYQEDTLVTDVKLSNDALGIEITMQDAIDFVVNALVRKGEVRRISGGDAEVRLFFHNDFHLYGNDIGDTAYYDPQLDALIHYKDLRYFLTDCASSEAGEGMSQYACGLKEFEGREGTWKDAEDGLLSGNPIAQGSVDSVMGLNLVIPQGGSKPFYYLMAVGENYHEVERLHHFIRSRGVEHFITRTANYWKLWSRKEPVDFTPLPSDVVSLYRRSLLTVMTNADADGGIIAGNDTDLLKFNRDTYSYVWPRDGALVAYALDNAGYGTFASNFYNFCYHTISSNGYFLQKYNPDGSFASSWHPWILDEKPSLPIQEDETALVLFSLWNHFSRYRDVEFIKPMYRPLIKNAADFMCSYVDDETGLPRDSYDLWEEKRGVFTFTCAAVYAGLTAASSFCRSFGEEGLALKYSSTAQSIKQATIQHLYSVKDRRFIKGLVLGDDGMKPDMTVDASSSAVFFLGMLPAGDPMVSGTMDAIRQRLWVRGPVGGIARYEGDMYQRQSGADIQGNPWFICTLWLADWYMEKASSRKDLAQALELLRWCTRYASPSGMLSEQIDPESGHPVSVSPLTWSHAAFIESVDRYLRRYSVLQ